jgi:hypothetical protein
MVAINFTQINNCSFVSLFGLDLCQINNIIQSVSIFIILIIATVSIICIFWKFIIPLLRDKNWEAVELNIELGEVGHVTIRPNHEIMRVAHQGWVDIVTRKAGLLFDEEHDVIIEVYDSWYTLFTEFRSLTKSIPAEKIRENNDARVAMDVFIRALNGGLRPHLTRYQAKFRRWYKDASDKYPDKSPQEIQKMYPEYDELVKDLKKVNSQMLSFGESLRKIAYGCKEEE